MKMFETYFITNETVILGIYQFNFYVRSNECGVLGLQRLDIFRKQKLIKEGFYFTEMLSSIDYIKQLAEHSGDILFSTYYKNKIKKL